MKGTNQFNGPDIMTSITCCMDAIMLFLDLICLVTGLDFPSSCISYVCMYVCLYVCMYVCLVSFVTVGCL